MRNCDKHKRRSAYRSHGVISVISSHQSVIQSHYDSLVILRKGRQYFEIAQHRCTAGEYLLNQ